jgi:hypothetical protein
VTEDQFNGLPPLLPLHPKLTEYLREALSHPKLVEQLRFERERLSHPKFIAQTEILKRMRNVRRPPQERAAPIPSRGQGLDPFRTGAPGRPTGAHLVLAEFERRLWDGKITPRPKGCSECARQLAEWYEVERQRYTPHGPPLSAKRVESIIRGAYRQATLL